MLIRFAVENFLSFKELTEFKMAASKITRHRTHVANCNGKRILKGAFIFGANASGKTNLASAISFAKDAILNGVDNTNCDKKYFRIDNSFKNKPSVFQFDIFFKGHFYSYGFALSLLNSSVEEEWLYQVDDGEKCIFLRTKSSEADIFSISTDMKFSSEKEKSRFALYSEDFQNSKMNQRLFLMDVAMRSPDNISDYQAFRDVVKWFMRLTIIFPDTQFSGITRILDDSLEKNLLEKLLQYFDTGITDLQKKEISLDKVFDDVPERYLDSIKADIKKRLNNESSRVKAINHGSRYEIGYSNNELAAYRIVANHGNEEELFEYSDESDGTQRLFDLLPIYQRIFRQSVIIIDEVDRSLHTKAVQAFINYFYSSAEDRNAQMIVTTHDSNIMDLELIRQDEVWFVERQEDHSSKLYSLNQFMVRHDKRVEKDYLIGRYGAIPVFKQYLLSNDADEDGEN